jgi:hypothetical protein
MPRLVRKYDLSIAAEIRHVVFAGEDAVAFTTRSADVWKVGAGPTPCRRELLFSAREVGGLVATAAFVIAKADWVDDTSKKQPIQIQKGISNGD